MSLIHSRTAALSIEERAQSGSLADMAKNVSELYGAEATGPLPTSRLRVLIIDVGEVARRVAAHPFPTLCASDEGCVTEGLCERYGCVRAQEAE